MPAHRPLAGAVAHPQPLATGLPTVPSVPAVPGVNNLTGLTFPWMESNRRYTKDRFTGESGPRAPRLAVARALHYPSPAWWLPEDPSECQVAQLLSLLAPSSAVRRILCSQNRCVPRVLAVWVPPTLLQDPCSKKQSWVPSLGIRGSSQVEERGCRFRTTFCKHLRLRDLRERGAMWTKCFFHSGCGFLTEAGTPTINCKNRFPHL